MRTAREPGEELCCKACCLAPWRLELLLVKKTEVGAVKMLFGLLQQNRAKQTLLKALVAELGGDVGT